MTIHEAGNLAKTVSLQDLRDMMKAAAANTKDWTKQSTINAVMTKGSAFNIFSKLELIEMPHKLAVRNMIWEFGEHLPNYEKPKRKNRKEIVPTHQEPRFEQLKY